MTLFRRLRVFLLVACLAPASGCQWWQSQMSAMRGEGFQDWNNSVGGNLRGKGDVKDSGYFWNTKAAQIEKNLGGGFD